MLSNIKEAIEAQPLLIPECDISYQVLSESNAGIIPTLSAHYKTAYQKGDFFASRYHDPESQIFSPRWLRGEIDNPKHLWVVFTRGEEFLGSTALFTQDDEVSIDETQISSGKGLKIMNHYFRKIVPILDQEGLDITTEFVLTPESKGLRRTLQTELGLAALGIHPHNLVSREGNFSASEISAAKYHNLSPRKAVLIPELYKLFNIVGSQLNLPLPEIWDENMGQIFWSAEEGLYEELLVDDNDPFAQGEAMRWGFYPVKYNPKEGMFTMAKYPFKNPNLGFIIAEGITANSALVGYIDSRLGCKI